MNNYGCPARFMEGLKYELHGLNLQIISHPFKDSKEHVELKARADKLNDVISNTPVKENPSYARRHPDELLTKKVMIK